MVNLGADFCMMPSMFEPGGIVQQEFFVAGTPVLAFKTGGLKDTVREFDASAGTGNGITFEAHNPDDFTAAMHRAMAIFHNQHQYAQIRANSRASVMDLSVVSLAWFREFHRLRRCLPPAPRRPPASVPVQFTLRVGEVPGCTRDSVVEVTGSFAAWTRKLPLTLSATGETFDATLDVAPGTYVYKFVVDGVWTTAPSAPVASDSAGICEY
jgi:hypothetical protein